MKILDLQNYSVKTKYIQAYELSEGMKLQVLDTKQKKYKYYKIEQINRDIDSDGKAIVIASILTEKRVFKYFAKDLVAIAILPPNE